MKIKNLFKIGFLCVFVFMVVGTYLWYLYFHNYGGDVLAKNVRLEIINNGRINYINAIPNDSEDVIPIYYFRVKNNVNVPLSFDILINDVSASSANDGCTNENLFKRDELNFELILDNKVIRTGKLSEISEDILDTQELDGSDTLDYSFRVWVNDSVLKTLGRHYHYVINIREKE